MKWTFWPLALSFGAAVCNGTDNDTQEVKIADSAKQEKAVDSVLRIDTAVADNKEPAIDTAAYNEKMRWMANGDSSGDGLQRSLSVKGSAVAL
ncbi:hypothetical protein LWM68_03845 [Niabella sp. W65]|nr:hypothetical protein [Niabella sp. W65]MCH7361983.1 hypothetical protein [Niabella sp. W65]